MSQSAICIDSLYSWTFNSLNQSPCVVAAYLASACTGTPPVVDPQLPPTWYYKGPSVSNATPCQCSTVYYSVTSACAVCQDGEYLSWSAWNTNCSSVYTTFPKPVPVDTRVPNWAYLPIGFDGLWDVFAAATAASGATATSIQTSLTGYPIPTAYTTPPDITTTVDSGGNTGGVGGRTKRSKSTNVGAIAGGAVGGVVGLALVALLGIFRRRIFSGPAPHTPHPTGTVQHPSTAPSGQSHIESTMAHIGSHIGSHIEAYIESNTMASSEPPKLYDPSDPSTFPALATVIAQTTSGSPSPVVSSDAALQLMGNMTPGLANLLGYQGSPQV